MKILSIVILLITALPHSADCQDISIVTGRFSDFEFSKISIQSDEDPFTGTRDEFEAIILDSGTFRIQAEFYAPKIFLLLVDDKPLTQFFLCPGEDLTIAADSSGLTGNLIYLDKKQSEDVRKALQIRGIPHYTLIDTNGVIVDNDAPHPDSGTIEIRLNELLGK